MPLLEVELLPVLTDNYVYLIRRSGHRHLGCRRPGPGGSRSRAGCASWDAGSIGP